MALAVASRLKRSAPELDVTLIEPADAHYCQPAFTLVGAGVTPLARTRKDEARLSCATFST